MNWRFLREINDKVWNRMASDIQSGGAKLAAYVKQNPRVFLYAARDFVVVFGFVHITTNYVGNITLCIGPSMKPTIKESGEFVYVDVFSQKFKKRDFQVGDIVICKCPYDSKKTICKRIKAIEGQVVKTEISEYGYKTFITALVPAGHIWLEGDNSSNSTDSRKYGPVPLDLVQGRVAYKLFPFKKL